MSESVSLPKGLGGWGRGGACEACLFVDAKHQSP